MSRLCFDLSIKCRFSLLSFYVLSYSVFILPPFSTGANSLRQEFVPLTAHFFKEWKLFWNSNLKAKSMLSKEKTFQQEKFPFWKSYTIQGSKQSQKAPLLGYITTRLYKTFIFFYLFEQVKQFYSQINMVYLLILSG